MTVRLTIAVAFAVAVTSQVWLPLRDCTANGNYWTRCVLQVEKIKW